jgi:DHA2 family multidrug resistance protein-like MFS transporter
VVLGTDLVVGAAPMDKAGSAAGISQTGTELGVALGIAILGSVGGAVYRDRMTGALSADLPTETAEAAQDSLAGASSAAESLPPDAAARLLESAGDAFSRGLGTVATVGAVVVAGLAIAATALLRHSDPTPEAQPSQAPEPAASRA